MGEWASAQPVITKLVLIHDVRSPWPVEGKLSPAKRLMVSIPQITKECSAKMLRERRDSALTSRLESRPCVSRTSPPRVRTADGRTSHGKSTAVERRSSECPHHAGMEPMAMASNPAPQGNDTSRRSQWDPWRSEWPRTMKGSATQALPSDQGVGKRLLKIPAAKQIVMAIQRPETGLILNTVNTMTWLKNNAGKNQSTMGTSGYWGQRSVPRRRPMNDRVVSATADPVACPVEARTKVCARPKPPKNR